MSLLLLFGGVSVPEPPASPQVSTGWQPFPYDEAIDFQLARLKVRMPWRGSG